MVTSEVSNQEAANMRLRPPRAPRKVRGYPRVSENCGESEDMRRRRKKKKLTDEEEGR